ncbi:hypothetical protein L9F63_010756 [Diploptera punctata]|uniref:Uncharacterized protein n=1 Tax=Diploptera punctata TaxID=6984 RepID=A0AAD8AIT2_DIPPU|nr:hypothetical protein L9F63_010756 [Diploptera punctata]
MSVFLYLAFNIPMVLFSGFYLRFKDIIVYLRWITEFSFYQFGFEGGMVILYGDRPNLDCSEPYCHYKNPSKLLEDFGMKNATTQRNYIALLIWVLIFQISLYFVLKWRIYKSR